MKKLFLLLVSILCTLLLTVFGQSNGIKIDKWLVAGSFTNDLTKDLLGYPFIDEAAAIPADGQKAGINTWKKVTASFVDFTKQLSARPWYASCGRRTRCQTERSRDLGRQRKRERASCPLAPSRLNSAGVGALMGTAAAHFSGGDKATGAIAGAAAAGLGMRLIAEPGVVAETGMMRGVKEMALLAVLTGGIAAKASGGRVVNGAIIGTLAAVPAFFVMMGAKSFFGF